jgi:Xaa-Pro aminopeptidase
MGRPDLGAFAHGPGAVDYETRVDLAAVRAGRVERVLEVMAAAGCDGLFVWKDENVRCLSGLRAQIIQGKSALLNGCLLRADGAMTLLLSGGEVDRARATMPWIGDVEAIPIMEARGLIRGAFETAIVPALRRLGLDRGRLGVDELA